MSKSRGNVINPDAVIDDYGADAFRLYEMFMGPLEQMKPWSMTGVEGVYRFLARVWRLIMEENQAGEWIRSGLVQNIEPTKRQRKVIHATIKKVGEDIEKLSFNTAIAQMMICVNELTGTDEKPLSAMRTLLVLLNPFAPHLTEELWETLGFEGLLCEQPWPEYNPEFLVEDEVQIVIQVNGKVRDRITVSKNISKENLEAIALATGKVQEFTGGKPARKVIVVPGKLVNVVV